MNCQLVIADIDPPSKFCKYSSLVTFYSIIIFLPFTYYIGVYRISCRSQFITFYGCLYHAGTIYMHLLLILIRQLQYLKCIYSDIELHIASYIVWHIDWLAIILYCGFVFMCMLCVHCAISGIRNNVHALLLLMALNAIVPLIANLQNLIPTLAGYVARLCCL